VLIEALSLGKPIVATECKTGVKEILMYGKAGTLTPVGDINAMCEAMNELLHDPILQQSYKTNSPKILAEFDIKTVIKQFEQLI
jgi:glycosyltransferase involved in cell wall biosynthesis